MKNFTLLFILILMALNVSSQYKLININENHNKEFEEINLSDLKNETFFEQAKRARIFQINNQLLSADNIEINDLLILNLFNDKKYNAYVDKINIDINGTLLIRARLTDYAMGYCLISSNNGKNLISVAIPELDEQYITRSNISDNHAYLFKLDKNKLNILPNEVPLIPPIDYSESHINTGNNVEIPPQEEYNKDLLKNSKEKTQISVMIVYTPTAASWSNSYDGGINNTISTVMGISQLVLDNSLVDVELNLVHSSLISYAETGIGHTDLSRLTFHEGYDPWEYENGPPWYMEEVHDWRKQYGANLVVLLANLTDAGGVGWLLTNKNGNSQLGFSVSHIQQVVYTYTAIHEIGHNMGCHHHAEQNTAPGPTIWQNWYENTWSAGWRWQGNNNNYYCSVMTYNIGSYFDDGINHTQVPYFSNPDITHQGVPAGHATLGDNARTIRETKNAVACYSYAVSVVESKNVSCRGGNDGEITLSITGGYPEYTIRWGSGNTGTLNNSGNYTITGLNAGVYIVTVTDENQCRKVAGSGILQPGNALTVTSVETKDVSCFDENNGEISMTISGGDPEYIIDWGGPDTEILGSAGDITITGLSTGNYIVTVTDDNECVITIEEVSVNEPEILTTEIISDTTEICAQNELDLSANAEGGTPPYSYKWSDTDQTDYNITVNPDITTTYTVTVTDSNDCETETSETITVFELPEIICPANFTVTVTQNVELTDASPEDGIYSGTGITENIFNPEGLNDDDYTITYTYTDDNGCINSCEFIITVNTGAGLITNKTSEISIFPNPNTGTFVIDFKDVTGEINYKIYDTKGDILLTDKFINKGNSKKEINLDFASGIYFIKIENSEKTIVEKIVVQ